MCCLIFFNVTLIALKLPPGPCRSALQSGWECAPFEFCWLAGLWNSCVIQSHPSTDTQWLHPGLLSSRATPVLLSCLLTVFCQEERKRSCRLSGVTGCHFPWECSWGCKRLHPRGTTKHHFAACQAGETRSPRSGEHTPINASNRSRLGITAFSDGGSKLSDYTRAAYPLFGKDMFSKRNKNTSVQYAFNSFVNSDCVWI